MTHTYLIASSVGGSILSIFREQEGEQARFSIWNRTVDPNKTTVIRFSNSSLFVFRGGLVTIAPDGYGGDAMLIRDQDSKPRSVRLTSGIPLTSVSVGVFDEYPISEPPAPSKPAPATKAKPAAKAKPAKSKRDTRKPPTDKQRRFLECLKSYRDKHGYSPTYDELCGLLGYKHPANIQGHVRLLKQKGYVTSESRKMRSLIPVNA